jgi:hypothetical protein
VKRFRFPLIAIAGFAIAYGIAWFVVREKYREERSPAHPSFTGQGTANEQFRQLMRMETDLVQGTAALARIIPQLTPQEAGQLLTDLSKGGTTSPPIWSQAPVLLQYRSEQSQGTSAPTEEGLFPVLVFDYSNPFPISEDGTCAFDRSDGFDAWRHRSSGGLSVSAIHWALMWLDRRSSAGGLAFLTDLGPAWQEAATQWLCNFVGGKSFADAQPWLEHIASPSVRSMVTDALFKNRLSEDWDAARKWALESPADRLQSLLNCAEASAQSRESGGAAFLLLTLLPDEKLERVGGRRRLIASLFHSAGSFFLEYIRTRTSDEELGAICWSLPGDGGRFNGADALKLLTVCEQTGDLDFVRRTRAELIAAWLRWRNPATLGPYENGMLQLAGFPFFPWFLPSVPEAVP